MRPYLTTNTWKSSKCTIHHPRKVKLSTSEPPVDKLPGSERLSEACGVSRLRQ